jgi:hypothetical protein
MQLFARKRFEHVYLDLRLKISYNLLILDIRIKHAVAII